MQIRQCLESQSGADHQRQGFRVIPEPPLGMARDLANSQRVRLCTGSPGIADDVLTNQFGAAVAHVQRAVEVTERCFIDI